MDGKARHHARDVGAFWHSCAAPENRDAGALEARLRDREVRGSWMPSRARRSSRGVFTAGHVAGSPAPAAQPAAAARGASSPRAVLPAHVAAGSAITSQALTDAPGPRPRRRARKVQCEPRGARRGPHRVWKLAMLSSAGALAARAPSLAIRITRGERGTQCCEARLRGHVAQPRSAKLAAAYPWRIASAARTSQARLFGRRFPAARDVPAKDQGGARRLLFSAGRCVSC